MNNIINIFKGGKKLKEETIKIEIEDENKNETSKGNVEFIDNVENLEYLNKKDVKGEQDMENNNRIVVNDFQDEKLINIGVENEEMDLFFILDRSGSMYGSESDTINGFNAFIEKQLAKNLNIRVTTILFDDKYEVLYSRKPIREVKPLTKDEYYVRGTTSLLDAIGRTITTYEREVNRAMCVITTDGYENSSKEFNRFRIKRMIESCGWEFIYIGADIDSYGEASRIGIRSSHVANYSKTSRGINKMYDAVDKVTAEFYCTGDINNELWKEDLEKDFEDDLEDD